MNRTFTIPSEHGATIIAEEILPDNPPPEGTPTVILAHGWCMARESWHKVVSELLTHRDVRIVIYDQRGHGQSTMGDLATPSVRVLGEDLYRVIQTTTPEGPLVLAGHSMGGMSIMAFAGLHHQDLADRVRGTVLASTAASIEGRSPVPLEGLIMFVASHAPRIAPHQLVPVLAQGRLIFGQRPNKDDVKHAVRQIQRTKMPTIGKFFTALADHHEVEALAHFVDVPTHILSGTRDRLIPVAHSEALKAEIPHAELTVLPGRGHMLPYEAADAIADAIISLFDGMLIPMDADYERAV
ncbi:MAG: alpha/beta hydrolase [Austwickia sp.]|nr:alpha/beta hydrolase [Austwickia sp.]MBK8436684.1 alpha/beta hydrolase [Austwickia sp.]MBK9100315.1 alpha/beta hydrolase [Austwickia sp.]